MSSLDKKIRIICNLVSVSSKRYYDFLLENLKQDSRAAESNKKLPTEKILLELNIYFLYRLRELLREYQNEKTEEKIVQYCSINILKHHETLTYNGSLQDIVTNRMNNYGKIFDETRKNVDFQTFFVALIKQTIEADKIRSWDLKKIPLEVDALESMSFKSAITSCERTEAAGFTFMLKNLLKGNEDFRELSMGEIKQRLEKGSREFGGWYKKTQINSRDSHNDDSNGEEEDDKNSIIPEWARTDLITGKKRGEKEKSSRFGANMVLGFVIGISFVRSLGFVGFIPYIIGIYLGTWFTRKMRNSGKNHLRLIYWMLFILFFFISVLVMSESNYGSYGLY